MSSVEDEDKYREVVREEIIAQLLSLEPDPLHRWILSTSILLSSLISYGIKIAVLLIAGIYTFLFVAALLTDYDLSEYFVFFIAITASAIPPYAIYYAWEAYLKLVNKRKGER